MRVRVGSDVVTVADADDLVEERKRGLRATAAGLVGTCPLGERPARVAAHDVALAAVVDAYRTRAGLWGGLPVPAGVGEDWVYALRRAAMLAERYDLDEARRYEGLIGGRR